MRGELGHAQGEWRGKARVKNLRSGQDAILNMDILAQEPSQLRMEVTGAFGVHLASVALSGSEVRYILTREKRFVVAPANSNSFARMVPVRISPTVLLKVLFDRDLPPDEWSCRRQGAGASLICRHRSEKIEIQWLERKDLVRRFKIITPDAEVEMLLSQSRSKVGLEAHSFELVAPDGFSQERIDI